MGRSYLSIKLALVFGLLIGAFVVQAERERVETTPQLPHSVMVVEPAAATAEPATVVCMWRGCPLLLDTAPSALGQGRTG